MLTGTLTVQDASAERPTLTIALAGNPNVGKSTIFNRLTGLGVTTAHYPGKTVELNVGTTQYDGRILRVVDLPGVYTLEAISEEQWVARRALLDAKPDVVVAIVDATNLERNLYVVLQLLDQEVPLVVALNLVDEAKRAGVIVDAELLGQKLGVPVIPVQGTTGRGIDDLVSTAVACGQDRSLCRPSPPVYGKDVAEHIAELASLVARKTPELSPALSPRGAAVLLLENDPEVTSLLRETKGGGEIVRRRESLARHIEKEHGESVEMRIARERHGLAGALAGEVRGRPPRNEPLAVRLWRWSIWPWTGLPILALMLATLFGTLYLLGNLLSVGLDLLWTTYVSPVIVAALTTAFGAGLITDVLRWGLDAGTFAILSVGVPYVLVFYFMLAFLEDSGYLNSIAFLLDNVMHRFGLHGQAAIPLVAAAGCNVPAMMSLRTMTSMRERMIASTLVVMVPCTARIAVIMGVVGRYAGWPAAVALIGTVTAITIASGLVLNKILPGSSSGLVMEMFPFRLPHVRTVLHKTWYRLHDFVFVAFPIVMVGSLGLGTLYETGWIWPIAKPLEPVVGGLMGLPEVAGLVLIFAVLRKELAMQLLVAIAVTQYGPLAQNLLHFMDAKQLFVFALVNTIYFPCLATIAVMARDLGWWRVAAISTFTVALAVLTGTAANHILALF
ncbi:MAG: ferrous iron transport protein B [Chloroflexota bacterium]